MKKWSTIPLRMKYLIAIFSSFILFGDDCFIDFPSSSQPRIS